MLEVGSGSGGVATAMVEAGYAVTGVDTAEPLVRGAHDQIWLVSFLDFDRGFFDREDGRVEPAPNPFVPEKVLTMSPE
jgi:hypothetical protein